MLTRQTGESQRHYLGYLIHDMNGSQVPGLGEGPERGPEPAPDDAGPDVGEWSHHPW